MAASSFDGASLQFRGDTLESHRGGHLRSNEVLTSPNSHFSVIMQHDGNLVLYKDIKPNPAGDGAIWSTKTYGQGEFPYTMEVQVDGNVVVYDGVRKPLWASNTRGNGAGPYRLVMQNDGNLVLYDSLNKATWSTDTWHHG
ncbi:hypothetical protein HYH03_008405 [Edaphochlamys debaryana]|uniref:Bulb-type lectin domain-containing protein n=1 Tax=Edaphochlamys debaryana TaxID=47281 RepID=A0A835Y244_9CHLO|nr:hypothetical protein HYH03_008405 [Edaphochlamys debaryana]|eukprot:KAG2493268.1 hypothetical protein HYH03_008405 [Edaphochlamys debaryana]